ncbi:MAG: HAMP domain-containing protein [Deltaproteobacteria bacterium]|nr:HAMP domain-containing protein [Deltaproteobacteria bacterium]
MLSIRTRLSLAVVMSSLTTVALGGIATRELARMQTVSDTLEAQLEKLLLVTDAQLATSKLVGPVALYAVTQKPEYQAELADVISAVEDRGAFLRESAALSAEERATLDRGMALLADVNTVAAKVMAPALPAATRAAEIERLQSALVSPMIEASGALRQGVATSAVKAREDAAAARRVATNLLIAVVVLALLSGSVVGWLIARSVVRPITAVVGVMQRIADKRGDLTERIPVHSRDEIGALCAGFNRLMDGIQGMVGTVAVRSGEVSGVSAELARTAGEIRASAESQRTGIDQAAAAVQAMDVAIHSVSDDVGALLRSAEKVSGASREVSAQISRVAGAMGDLDGAVERTAATVRNVGAAASRNADHAGALRARSEDVEEKVRTMSSAIRGVRDLSREQAAMAKAMVEVVTSQRQVVRSSATTIDGIIGSVREASALIRRLAERSEKISGIVGVIGGVANQTNLLALNASILAARAGEQGRGFNVVADEIRGLADKTRASTKDIAKLVNEVQGDLAGVIEGVEASTSALIEQTVRFSRETDSALAGIGERSLVSRDTASRVEAASDEQAGWIKAVEGALTEMGQMVRQIKEATDAQTGGVHEILAAAEDMHRASASVRASTTQQAGESERVSSETRELTINLKRIATAVAEHEEAGRLTVRATAVIKEAIDANVGLAKALDASVVQLEQGASSMATSVGGFKA